MRSSSDAVRRTERPSERALALSLVVNVEEGSEMGVLPEDTSNEPVDEMGISLRKEYRKPRQRLQLRLRDQRGARPGRPGA